MPFPHSTRTLTSILVECGIITDAQVEQALARQRETGLLIGETMVELGFTTEENIGWALSRQLGFPYADVHPSSVDPTLVKRYPESLLRRLQAVPLFGTEEEITFAMADPTDVDAVAELKTAAGVPASLVIGGPGSIRRVLDSVYGPPEAGSPHAAPPPTSRRDIVWDRAGTNFLAYHLHQAVLAKASEIHFIPVGSDLTVAYRTDAGLEPQSPEQPETSLYLRARLGVLGVSDVDEGRTSATGSAVVELGPDRIAVIACHTRTESGVATVMRLGPAPVTAPDLSLLGLSPLGEAEIREFIDGPEGLIVVTGPPRAGGSMLLASLAALAARPDRRAIVFESVHLAPYAAGTIRIPIHEASAAWEAQAVGLGADVVVLDGAVSGERVESLLHGAAVGRLVFARTDWLDPNALLAFLTRSRAGRAALRDRPFALIALPAARREGSAVWVDPTRVAIEAGSLQVTILSDEKRDALGKVGR